MEGRKPRVVGDGLVRAKPFRLAKQADRGPGVSRSAWHGSGIDRRWQAGNAVPSSLSVISAEAAPHLCRAGPDGNGLDGCGFPDVIRLSRRKRSSCGRKMVSVSLPLGFGLGCGTGTNSLGHVMLRLWRVDIGGSVDRGGGDPPPRDRGADEAVGVTTPFGGGKTKGKRGKSGRGRGRRDGRNLQLGSGVKRCGGILDATCVLLSAKAFFPWLGRGLWACLAAVGIGEWATRHLGKHLTDNQTHYGGEEGTSEESGSVWGGVSWPERVEEFSIAALVLSLAVPFLQWRFPAVHHSLRCWGAAVPVMAGYAQTSSILKGQIVGASGYGEELWRKRHRWAAERLCHLLTGFTDKPAFGWLVSAIQASSLVLETAADACSSGSCCCFYNELLGKSFGSEGFPLARAQGVVMGGANSSHFGDFAHFAIISGGSNNCNHVNEAVRRVWGSIALSSAVMVCAASSHSSSPPSSRIASSASNVDEAQIRLDGAVDGGETPIEDGTRDVIRHARSPPLQAVFQIMAGRLFPLSSSAAVVALFLSLRNPLSLLPLQMSPSGILDQDVSVSTASFSTMAIEHKPLSSWQISPSLLVSQLVWLSSLWTLSSLQATRRTSSAASSQPSRDRTLTSDPSYSRLNLANVNVHGNERRRRLAMHGQGSGYGVRITIDLGGGRRWTLECPAWATRLGTRRTEWIQSLSRGFHSEGHMRRWWRRQRSAMVNGQERMDRAIFASIQSYLEYVLEIFFLFLRAIWLILIFSPLVTVAPFLYLMSSYLGENKRKRLRSAVWILLRSCLEKSGAAFIKWGQWSATREDLFPEDLCDCLSRLHDQAPTHSARQTRGAIQQNLGLSIEELFDNFDEKPLASGSIAQVHRALLKDRGDGTPRDVVVKVRHPKVALRIRQDFRIMTALANAFQRLPALRWLNLKQSVQQFSHTMTAQADLRVEAKNLTRFYNNFSGLHQSVIPPRLISDLVSEGVIVETFERGSSLHEFLRHRSSLSTQIAAVGVDTFLKMMLADNFVHMDLHPGNILARVAGDDDECDRERSMERLQLVLLDFGMAEELSPTVRTNFISFIQMIGAGDGRRAAEYLLRWSDPEPQMCQSAAELAKDMEELFDEECQLKNGPIDLNGVLKKVLRLARKHEVTVNSAYAALVVSVSVLVGFSESLDPDLSIMDAAVPCLFTYNLTGLVLGRIYG